jgi:hypothetical protein
MRVESIYLWIKTLLKTNRRRRNSESISSDGIKNYSLRPSLRDRGIQQVPYSRGRDALAQSFLLQARCHDDWS